MPDFHVTMERLDDQIAWYDRKSENCKKFFKTIKIIEIVSATSIPLLAGYGVGTPVLAGLGALIAILEGVQHLNQYQHNWITYRATCEVLKHEKFLYLAGASHYANTSDPHKLLAERVEILISKEHTKWLSAQQKPLEKPPNLHP